MQTLDQIAIDTLIPHRPPMQLLTRILATDDKNVWSGIALDAQAPFVTQGQIPAVITLEYVAQTAAAFFSLQQRTEQTGTHPPAAPRPGMLIACNQLTSQIDTIATPTTLVVQASLASALPKSSQASALVRFTGTVFDLRIAPTTEADARALIDATAHVEPIAHAALSVFLPVAGESKSAIS